MYFHKSLNLETLLSSTFFYCLIFFPKSALLSLFCCSSLYFNYVPKDIFFFGQSKLFCSSFVIIIDGLPEWIPRHRVAWSRGSRWDRYRNVSQSTSQRIWQRRHHRLSKQYKQGIRAQDQQMMTMHFTEIIFRIYVSDPYSFDFDPGFFGNLNLDPDPRFSIKENCKIYRWKIKYLGLKNCNPGLGGEGLTNKAGQNRLLFDILYSAKSLLSVIVCRQVGLISGIEFKFVPTSSRKNKIKFFFFYTAPNESGSRHCEFHTRQKNRQTA